MLLLAGCGPRYAPPPSGEWAQLERTPTLFMRVYGSGAMPVPAAAVAYELCYNFAQDKVVEVHDAATGRRVASPAVDALLAWKWKVLSSVRLTGGVHCWRERFEPLIAPDGSLTVRATAGEPVGLMRLDDGSVMAAHGRPETEESVAFVDRFDHRGVRYVMLAPRLDATGPKDQASPPATFPRESRLAGDLPHLSDVTKLRFRGNTIHVAFQVCVGADGRVERIVPELPLDGATADLVRALRTWRFTAPRSPICSLVEFVFTIG